MNLARLRVLAVFIATGVAHAQAPAAGPLVLLLPASTRALGVGNAPIRDDYSIFYDPARIAPTSGIGASFARYESNGTFGAFASGVSVGPLNYGWGVEMVQFRALTSSPYPYAPVELVTDGTRNALSLAVMAGAELTYKRFNLGLGLKFAEDRVDGTNPPAVGPSASPAIQRNVLLADVGATHALFGGTAEVAVQNIGDRSRYPVPTTATLGWFRTLRTDQFDFLLAGDLAERQSWLGGGGGAEIGWGWIEGWSAALRAGARRPETRGQHPLTIGGTLNADRLALDYALEFFDGNRYAHHLSIRWR